MALKPITRQEQIIAGKDLKPITRMEQFLKEYGGGGGGSAPPAFVVRLSLVGDSDEFIADKTYDEIASAIKADKPVICYLLTGEILNLSFSTSIADERDYHVFVSVGVADGKVYGTQVQINADESVMVAYG